MERIPTLWLRDENNPRETRTILTPSVAAQLVAAGHTVVVEESASRIIPHSAFLERGCLPAKSGAWQKASSDTVVLGLKAPDIGQGPFLHRHIHFAHVFKQQKGARETLHQYVEGNGTLFDLEYLVNESGERVVAFGHWAGYIGAALALLALANQQGEPTPLDNLQPWPSREALQRQVIDAVSSIRRTPRVLVIGASGRCGTGAVALCRACGIEPTSWGRNDTAAGGPFDELLAHDVLINCVFVDCALSPFTTLAHLQHPKRRLAVISDVSCDPGTFNSLPIYSKSTTQSEPLQRLIEPTRGNPVPLDITSIDHLPSLLPVESSEDFAEQLAPHLLAIGQLDQGVWRRARAVFEQHRDAAWLSKTG